MKKIVSIGKFNVVFQEINKYLSHYYETQICVDNYNMVKSMLESKKPDCVFISLVGLDQTSVGIFGELKRNYAHCPILCMGTKQEQEVFGEYLKLKNFHALTRPVTSETIQEMIEKLFQSPMREEDTSNEVQTSENEARKSILLVDDNATQLRALGGMLKEKYDVQMATSGMKALDLIQSNVPDIIFLDYEMPIYDGKMTLEKIREVEAAKNVPVVFLTGVRDKEHIQAVLELKPAGYLLKPASADMIYDVLGRVLKKAM